MASTHRFTSFLVVVLMLGALRSAQAQTPAADKIWTTVGSTGTVDETDVGKVFFNESIVQMGNPIGPVVSGRATRKASATILGQTRSAVIRYNVTPVEGLFNGPFPAPSSDGLGLTLRYLDAGPSGRVVAELFEVDLASGAKKSRVTFDSNSPAFKPANNYQVQSVGKCEGPALDFVHKAYYVEVTLTGSTIAAGSAAGVQIIKITRGCLG
jgi:hypothetical protein